MAGRKDKRNDDDSATMPADHFYDVPTTSHDIETELTSAPETSEAPPSFGAESPEENTRPGTEPAAKRPPEPRPSPKRGNNGKSSVALGSAKGAVRLPDRSRSKKRRNAPASQPAASAASGDIGATVSDAEPPKPRARRSKATPVPNAPMRSQRRSRSSHALPATTPAPRKAANPSAPKRQPPPVPQEDPAFRPPSSPRIDPGNRAPAGALASNSRPQTSDPSTRPPSIPNAANASVGDPSTPLVAGDRVGTNYTIVRHLGKGGMAEVYLAEQSGVEGFRKPVVIKRILPDLVTDDRFVEMFVREAHVASSLTHANVVQIFELGEDRGTYFIAMEYVPGITLSDLADRAWKLGRTLPLELVLHAAADAAQGLDYGWRKTGPDGNPLHLVHRDVSPDNLMINAEGTTKVLDFGIAKAEGSADLTMVGEIKGKMSYLPPEQITQKGNDHRSDLYSLGVTTYFLVTKQLPFSGDQPIEILKQVLHEPPIDPRKLNPALSDEGAEFVLGLLSKSPDDRFDDGQDLAEEVILMVGPSRRNLMGAFVQEITDAVIPDNAVIQDVPAASLQFDSVTGSRALGNRALAGDAQGTPGRFGRIKNMFGKD